jgi:hypothetical protein
MARAAWAGPGVVDEARGLHVGLPALPEDHHVDPQSARATAGALQRVRDVPGDALGLSECADESRVMLRALFLLALILPVLFWRHGGEDDKTE